MNAIGTTIKFLPVLLFILIYVALPHPFSGLTILLFMIYGKIVVSDDVARIEHKVDVLFALLKEHSTEALDKVYTNLHATAWDHEGVYEVTDSLLDQAKSVATADVIVAVASKIIIIGLSLHFIFEFIRQHLI